jgi:hypothetical protein
MIGAALVFVLFSTGCSPTAPPADTKPADAKPAAPEKGEPLPSDVPVPLDIQGRKDSTLPGTKFHVVQGQVPSTVPDASAAIRKQAEEGGWKAVGEPAPAPDGSVETLTFEKDARSLKITLVKAQNTVTSMNLLTGPK